MAQNFDTGRQARLDIVANGVVLVTTTLTQFTDKQQTIDLKHRPLNGPPVHKKINDGWEGSFEIDRDGPVLDDFFSSEETQYYAGAPNADIFITKTVTEADGSISQYRHEGVMLKFDDGGVYKQDDKVSQKVSFMSTLRPKIA